ncbi:hypothetical protein F5051DRAFT_419380 [Lentinula edodes]|nr:hypothetical protein F5051DRAFT_419380 [Lentinula edodes]
MRSWMEDIFFQRVHSGSPWSCITFVLFTFSLKHSAPALSSTISHDRTQASGSDESLLYPFLNLVRTCSQRFTLKLS